MDGSTIYSKDMIELASSTARENDIKFQIKNIVAGGNDSSAYQRTGTGARVMALSAPVRYIHSPSSVSAVSDLESVLNLANALNRKDFAE